MSDPAARGPPDGRSFLGPVFRLVSVPSLR